MSINGYFVIAGLALLSFVSCDKESDSLPPKLKGKWELESVQGGWVGHQTYPRGNGNTFVFKNNTYLQTVRAADTSYQYSGTFSIFSGKPCEMSREQTLIQLDSSQIKYSFSFS